MTFNFVASTRFDAAPQDAVSAAQLDPTIDSPAAPAIKLYRLYREAQVREILETSVVPCIYSFLALTENLKKILYNGFSQGVSNFPHP